MVLVYVSLIMNGLRKLEDVPNAWRADVEIKLEELKPIEGEEAAK